MYTSEIIFCFLLLVISSNAQNQIIELNTNNKEVIHVTAKLNTTLDIRVKGNPSTGYNWYLENAEEIINAKVLTPLNLTNRHGSKNFVQNAHTQGAIGVGGSYSFQFLPSANGRATISLIYKRPWLKNSEKTYTLEVTVGKPEEEDD